MSGSTHVGTTDTGPNSRAEGEHFDLRAARGFAVVVALSVASWVAIAAIL